MNGVARLLLTPRWIGFTALMATVATACMVLGWWQFQRYQDAGGSFQNLGYTLNWPLFGAFAAYLWWRLLRDAARPDPGPRAAGDPAASPAANPAARPERSGWQQETQPAGSAALPTALPTALPAERVEPDDPELAAYNRFLADLAERGGR